MLALMELNNVFFKVRIHSCTDLLMKRNISAQMRCGWLNGMWW